MEPVQLSTPADDPNQCEVPYGGRDRQCPGQRRCEHAEGELPAFYFTLHRRRWICEDSRLWRCYQAEQRRRLEFGDDDDRRQGRVVVGFAAARAELIRRRRHVKREFLQIVALAGEPEVPVYDDEVPGLLNEIIYCLDALDQAKRAPP